MSEPEDGRLKVRTCPTCGRDIRGPAFFRHVKAHARETAITAAPEVAVAESPEPCAMCPNGPTHVCIDGAIVFAAGSKSP